MLIIVIKTKKRGKKRQKEPRALNSICIIYLCGATH